MLQATWNGLTFIGDDAPATYTLNRRGGLVGWFEGLEARHESIERPLSNGDFDAPVTFGGRLLTLSGLILIDDDPVDYETAIDALATAGDDGGISEFAVTQATGTFGVMARRHGASDIGFERYGIRASYMLQLWAPDGAKYVVTP